MIPMGRNGRAGTLLWTLAAGLVAGAVASAEEPGADLLIGPEPLREAGAPEAEEVIAGRARPARAVRLTAGPEGREDRKAAELMELAARALLSEGSPAETRAQLALARGRAGEALALLESRRGRRTESRRTVLRALALMSAGEPGEAAGLLREAAAAIESKGALAVRTLSFAGRVMSFGVWDEAPALFAPRQRAMIYCEILGFACVKRGPKEYSVGLRMKLAVEREDGSTVVETLRDDPVDHKTKSRIHDLHLCTQFDLPPDLGPGSYVLRATVTDRATGAASSVGVPFEVSSARGGH